MTRAQIEAIARKHEVDESHIRGANKAELLRNIDRWYSGLAYHEILAGNAHRSNFAAKRDALRQELGIS